MSQARELNRQYENVALESARSEAALRDNA